MSSQPNALVKEGFKSTEFVLALIVLGLAAAIVGVELRENAINVASSVAIVSAAFTSIGYSRSRAQVKTGR